MSLLPGAQYEGRAFIADITKNGDSIRRLQPWLSWMALYSTVPHETLQSLSGTDLDLRLTSLIMRQLPFHSSVFSKSTIFLQHLLWIIHSKKRDNSRMARRWVKNPRSLPKRGYLKQISIGQVTSESANDDSVEFIETNAVRPWSRSSVLRRELLQYQ
jgi:hypothetical protein